MLRSAALVALTVTATLATALTALADGCGEEELVARSTLPRALRDIHTCIPADGQTALRKETAGKHYVFGLDCPVNAPGLRHIAVQTDGDAGANDESPDHVYYVADRANARGAKRIAFPFLTADGRETMVDMLPVVASIGRATRSDTSDFNGAAWIRYEGEAHRDGSFDMLAEFVPADRPDLKGVVVIWRIKGAKAEMIYWAESTEAVSGENPTDQYPRYTVKLDRRAAA